jgi:hypothetical protein
MLAMQGATVTSCPEAAQVMTTNTPEDEVPHTARGLSLAPVAKWWPVVLALLLCAAASWKVIASQWDFEVYYYAARALRAGLDPYNPQSLGKVAGKPMPLPFVYPPAFLALFAPIASLSLTTAKAVYLAAKLAALAGLLAIWGGFCRSLRETAILLVVVLLGFNATTFSDLYAGNITCFEQLLLWLGITALLTGRRMLFAVLIPVAATPKYLPMALALLLLFEGRKAIPPLLVSAGSFLAIQGISLAVSPARTARFFTMASALDERGRAAPSSLALLRDTLSPALRPWVPLVLYIVVAVAVLAVFGLLAVRLHKRETWQKAPWFLLSGALLSYLLIIPRLKSYGFVLVIPVAVWLLARAKRGTLLVGTLLLCLSTTSPLPKALLPGSQFWPILWEYNALLGVFALWLLWCGEARTFAGLLRQTSR